MSVRGLKTEALIFRFNIKQRFRLQVMQSLEFDTRFRLRDVKTREIRQNADFRIDRILRAGGK